MARPINREFVAFRCSEQLKADLLKASEQTGESVAELIRRAVAQHLKAA